ncbi:MAG: type IV pilin protein [Cellvibrionaceae bacterium]|nr:type IV pilin protein [Cellvibrionaceae bacterium]
MEITRVDVTTVFLGHRGFASRRGFSLIELMIALSIVAILAMIMYPSYTQSIEKSRRTDARAALTEIAAQQEKFYFKDSRYSDSLNQLFGGTASREGYYVLAVDTTASGTGCGADGECFKVSATATGTQAGDSNCRSFTLNNIGLKGASNDNGSDTTASCW